MDKTNLATKHVRVRQKTIDRLNKERKKYGGANNDFIINRGLDLLSQSVPPVCFCGARWGHRGKHWANTEVKG